MSLPVNLGQRLSSKSSPSLSVTKEEDEDEDEDDNFKGSGQPQPDYSPEREPKLDNSQRQKVSNFDFLRYFNYIVGHYSSFIESQHERLGKLESLQRFTRKCFRWSKVKFKR